MFPQGHTLANPMKKNNAFLRVAPLQNLQKPSLFQWRPLAKPLNKCCFFRGCRLAVPMKTSTFARVLPLKNSIQTCVFAGIPFCRTSGNLCLLSQGAPPWEGASAIGVGISVPLALDAIGVETATIGVETGIPTPKEAGVEIGVGICHWR